MSEPDSLQKPSMNDLVALTMEKANPGLELLAEYDAGEFEFCGQEFFCPWSSFTHSIVHENDILELHAAIDGKGIRDMCLLLSAVKAQDNLLSHECPDFLEVAALLVEKLVKNHPFVDGNKRTALAACIFYFLLNELTPPANPKDLACAIIGLADGSYAREDFVRTMLKGLF